MTKATSPKLAQFAVCVPGWPKIELREVILESEPPHRFVYRVISGAPVRYHQGAMTLTELSNGRSSLRWEVEIEPEAAALARLIRRRLEIVHDIETAAADQITMFSEKSPSFNSHGGVKWPGIPC